MQHCCCLCVFMSNNSVALQSSDILLSAKRELLLATSSLTCLMVSTQGAMLAHTVVPTTPEDQRSKLQARLQLVKTNGLMRRVQSLSQEVSSRLQVNIAYRRQHYMFFSCDIQCLQSVDQLRAPAYCHNRLKMDVEALTTSVGALHAKVTGLRAHQLESLKCRMLTLPSAHQTATRCPQL